MVKPDRDINNTNERWKLNQILTAENEKENGVKAMIVGYKINVEQKV